MYRPRGSSSTSHSREADEGGGPLVAFQLRADKAATFRFMDALRVINDSNNLGDAKSLIAHPATTTHQRLKDEAKAELGITPGTVRLSVGLEHPDDLMADLAQALSEHSGVGKVYSGKSQGSWETPWPSFSRSAIRTALGRVHPASEGSRRGPGSSMCAPSRNHGTIRNSTRMRWSSHCEPLALRTSKSPYLGGLRSRREDQGPSPNGFWENENFRNYADYTATQASGPACGNLQALGEVHACAIMCAEAVWWRCHRQIITDYLLAAGATVQPHHGRGQAGTAC